MGDAYKLDWAFHDHFSPSMAELSKNHTHVFLPLKSLVCM
jgi:hypothetical protein